MKGRIAVLLAVSASVVSASYAAEEFPAYEPVPDPELPNFNFELPSFSPPPGAPPVGLPPANAPPAAGPAIGLPGADTPSFPGVRPPDPIITNLNPEDRERVLTLVMLAAEFLTEIGEKRDAYRNTYMNYAAITGLLDAAYQAEGAQRRSRAVTRNLQLEPSLTGERGALSYVDNMMGKYTPTYVSAAEVAGHRNCRPDDPLASGLVPCFEHQPTDWMVETYPTLDWYERAVYDQGGTLLGDLPAFIAETVDDFYFRYATRLERLRNFVGRDAASTSVFLSGLDVGYDAQSRKIFDMPAVVGPDNLWSLDAGMRSAVLQMTEYLEGARASWRTYERAIASEYPGLVARAHARWARRLQDHGAAQIPLYTSLLAEYGVAPDLLTAAGGGPAEYRTLQSAWMAPRQADLRRLDVLFNCGSPDPARQRAAVDNLAAGIFFNPVFYIVELADGVAPGESPPIPLDDGTFLGEPVYVKGEVDLVGVAEPANGLAIMPAGGGLTLGDCELLRGGEGEAAAVQIAAEEVRAFTAFGAADTALP